MVVWIGVTVVLLVSSLWILRFVSSQTASTEEAPATNPLFINYSTGNQEYIQPESLAAMAVYIAQNVQPQNAQVLTGMLTAEIAAYMVNHVASGLQVDCTYCHNVQNFGADEWDDPDAMARRVTARAHLRMVGDINRDWLSQLPTLTTEKIPYGAQVTCATCHYGEPLPVAWEPELNALPDDFRLPLDNIDQLLVTANLDVSLDTVQINQYTMYHMNTSLNVGCTHCHNSRYFPSWEVPAKYYALHMLNMSQYIRDTYQVDMNGQEPSCQLCHKGNILPPGAAVNAASLPAVLTANQQTASSE
ncbi:MAG: photosynthetic reaction center cytochrome c subunit [Caldilineaceae bacterium]|nr:photosynthetic reaction center cytochrome c subunit [Caldilineaceae bacterium]